MRCILWFDEIKKSDLGNVGGKGLNLGIMKRAGFPIPEGFVVTAKAYWEFLERAKIKKKIINLANSINVENTTELENKSNEIRKIITSAKIPKNIEQQIKDAYSKIQGYVAVRSSATAEDLPTASFAGQQETYLNILGGKNVVNSVRKCWASLFTPRAIYYRKKQGFATEKVGIAVVVQKMVNSDVAGVLFTTDPTGDKRKLIIEAAYGLGEVVVSGAVVPDHYVVKVPSMKIAEKKISKQGWKLVRAKIGNIKKKVEANLQKKQKLSDDLIIKLAKIGKKIEKYYKTPQDIEWAVENNEIYIVQSRSITTLGLKDTVSKYKEIVKAKPLLTGLAASPGAATGKVALAPTIKEIGCVHEGNILVTKMTAPDWVPVMKKAAAIITDEGGLTCHAAIVSRELQIPCIVGVGNATTVLKQGQEITVDGFSGKIYAGKIKIPTVEKTKREIIKDNEVKVLEKKLKEYFKKHKIKFKPRSKNKKKQLEEMLRKISPQVKVNVALPEAAENAAKTGADGVGLLRAEHMITATAKHPAELIRRKKQKELIKLVHDGVKIVASHFKNKPVWYRTFDARTDEFRQLEGGEKEPHEPNPMLGWHGIRRDLDTPEMFEAQLKAIKQLRKEGYKNIAIMLPFVQNPEEFRIAKQLAEKAGISKKDGIKFGIMVETPGAVWTIDEFIKEGIAFASFGTNDLTQLTLGIDRGNAQVQKWFTELHPAIIRSIEYVIKKCKKAGVETSICGQAGSNPEMVRKLVKMGISSISANIDAVDKIRAAVLEAKKELILSGKCK